MTSRRFSRYRTLRSVEWLLLSVAVFFALAFAAALACVWYLFMHSWAGMSWRYILVLAPLLASSVGASLWLARIEMRRRALGWACLEFGGGRHSAPSLDRLGQSFVTGDKNGLRSAPQ